MCQNAVRQSCYLYNKKKLNKTKTSHNQLFCFYINFSKFNEACQNLTFILRFFQITRSWKYTGCVTELYDTSKKGKKKKRKRKSVINIKWKVNAQTAPSCMGLLILNI